jgi:hypothetical protein
MRLPFGRRPGRHLQEPVEPRHPDILYPGDILFLPPFDPKPLPFKKATKNTYQVHLPSLTIRLCLRDELGKPSNQPRSRSWVQSVGSDGCPNKAR